jgi:hypothetical protein
LTYKDMPAVRRIIRQAAADNYKFSALVLGIATSEQFRLMRLPEGGAVTAGLSRD